MNPQQKNDNPYALLIRRMIIIAVALNAVAAMAWISGIELAGITLGTFAFMISVIIAVLLPAGKKAALRISSLREGNGLLLRWEYTAEPFRNFTVAEYRRQLTNANITAGVLVLAGPVVGLYKDGEEGLLVGIAVGVGLALLAYLLGFLMAKDFTTALLSSVRSIDLVILRVSQRSVRGLEHFRSTMCLCRDQER